MYTAYTSIFATVEIGRYMQLELVKSVARFKGKIIGVVLLYMIIGWMTPFIPTPIMPTSV